MNRLQHKFFILSIILFKGLHFYTRGSESSTTFLPKNGAEIPCRTLPGEILQQTHVS